MIRAKSPDEYHCIAIHVSMTGKCPDRVEDLGLWA